MAQHKCWGMKAAAHLAVRAGSAPQPPPAHLARCRRCRAGPGRHSSRSAGSCAAQCAQRSGPWGAVALPLLRHPPAAGRGPPPLGLPPAVTAAAAAAAALLPPPAGALLPLPPAALGRHPSSPGRGQTRPLPPRRLCSGTCSASHSRASLGGWGATQELFICCAKPGRTACLLSPLGPLRLGPAPRQARALYHRQAAPAPLNKAGAGPA